LEPTVSGPPSLTGLVTMDGVLRKLTDRTWEGTLHGYRVQVFDAGGGWHVAVINDRGHVKVCPRVPSLAEGARRARAWVAAQQQQPPPPARSSAGLRDSAAGRCNRRGAAALRTAAVPARAPSHAEAPTANGPGSPPRGGGGCADGDPVQVQPVHHR
jgi:hypothetical protein